MKEDKDMKEYIYSAEHIHAVNRRRRIFFQYDDFRIYKQKDIIGGDMDSLLEYSFCYVDRDDSQIDSVCFDIGNEGQVIYPSKILPFINHPGFQKWRMQGIDYIERIIAAGHERGKEMFLNHRISEIERGNRNALENDSSTDYQLLNPVKAVHPDWVIKSWWWQGNWNLAVDEVRKYKLDILTEIAYQYDLDGIQIDFARHPPFLPPGRQWEHRGELTEFIAEIRLMLLKCGAERNRPFLLAVRVPENLNGCQIDGIDIEKWICHDLIDIIVIGTRTMRVDIQAFRHFIGHKNIKLIPSFDGGHTTDAYCIQTIEFLRGVFTNWWHQGADSAGTFNWAPASPEISGKMGIEGGSAIQEIANREIGDLQTLINKNRFYAIERRGGFPFCEGYFGRNDEAPLPILLHSHGATAELPIMVWEGIADNIKLVLRIVLFNFLRKDEIAVTLNGHTVTQIERDPSWLDPQIYSPAPQPVTMNENAYLKTVQHQALTRIDFQFTNGIMRRGENIVGIRVTHRECYKPSQYIKVEKVEIHVM